MRRPKYFGLVGLGLYSHIHRHLLLLLEINIGFKFWSRRNARAVCGLFEGVNGNAICCE